MNCVDCNDSLTRCGECRRTVCPMHRLGTGSFSEGYFCSLGCSLVNAGMVPRPNQSLVEKVGVIPVICGVVIIVWSVIAALLLK